MNDDLSSLPIDFKYDVPTDEWTLVTKKKKYQKKNSQQIKLDKYDVVSKLLYLNNIKTF